MELLSGRAYAKRRGVSHTAVQNAIRDGRISTVEGKIDPAVADREWAENTDPSTSRNSITGTPKGHRRGRAPPKPNEIDGGGNGRATGYSRARAAREAALAGIERLKLEQMRGELVRVEEVRRAFFNASRKARDELYTIPAQLAPVLSAINDAAELEGVLFEAIERVCKGLSDGAE